MLLPVKTKERVKKECVFDVVHQLKNVRAKDLLSIEDEVVSFKINGEDVNIVATANA